MSRKSFVFYESFLEQINSIPDEGMKMRFLMAIINYGINGESPNFDEWYLNSMFAPIKPIIDSAEKKYNASVANGKKGGRPKKETQETQEKPRKTQETQNDSRLKPQNLNDNVNDNVNDNTLSINIDNDNKHEQSHKGSAQFVNKNAELRKKYGIGG